MQPACSRRDKTAASAGVFGAATVTTVREREAVTCRRGPVVVVAEWTRRTTSDATDPPTVRWELMSKPTSPHDGMLRSLLGSPRRPIVVPIVVCHGKKRWWAPLRFESLVGDPDRRIPWMQDKIPSFTYLVVDLTAMTNAQIVDLAASASLRLFLLIMKWSERILTAGSIEDALS